LAVIAGLRLRWELMRWRSAGRQAQLWWRDDDVAGACPVLERLLALAQSAGAPLTLAVIPASALAGLSQRLAGTRDVTTAQHGADHVNRRVGPAAGEFPPEWSGGEVRAAILAGWMRMRRLPGALKVFVPPWNDIHPQLPAVLAAEGYAAWSAHGALGADMAGAVARIDVHLDLLRWRGGARFRGRRRFLGELAAQLRRRRRAGRWGAPIGLLTHHLAHDERAWAFLAEFLPWAAREPALAWRGLEDLIDAELGCAARP
jgi:hypothetical protein